MTLLGTLALTIGNPNKLRSLLKDCRENLKHLRMPTNAWHNTSQRSLSTMRSLRSLVSRSSETDSRGAIWNKSGRVSWETNILFLRTNLLTYSPSMTIGIASVVRSIRSIRRMTGSTKISKSSKGHQWGTSSLSTMRTKKWNANAGKSSIMSKKSSRAARKHFSRFSVRQMGEGKGLLPICSSKMPLGSWTLPLRPRKSICYWTTATSNSIIW